MAGNANRVSTYTSISSNSDKTAEQKKDLWQTLLGEVATGKQFPQKNLLVLGDSVAGQKQFLESLSNLELRQSLGKLRGDKIPDIANSFALGNTYYDVIESDQDADILARISVYLLSRPSPSFASLVKPLLTPEAIPNTLVVILLNWSKPWTWLREIRQWILLLKKVIMSLSMESKDSLEEVMEEWKHRGRVGSHINLDGTPAAQMGENDAALPIGSGEWDEELGLPLCVVCQNAEKMDILEKSAGWKEEQFDLVLQYMRTILLKHGASLIYTSPSTSSPLQNLVHSSLGIKSLSSKKEPLKHNAIDRDKILVPPNWDSWSKIRVLREGFNVEETSAGWAIDLDQVFFPTPVNGAAKTATASTSTTTDAEETSTAVVTANTAANGNGADTAKTNGIEDLPGSTVPIYEEQIRDPSFDTQLLASQADEAAKFEATTETQEFLTQQQKVLDTLKKKAEAEGDNSRRPKTSAGVADVGSGSGDDEAGAGGAGAHYLSGNTEIAKKIGPVQFNMGGIQVDADDMVARIKERQAAKGPVSPTAGAEEAPEAQAKDMEKLQAFFTGLISKKPRSGA